MLIRIISGAVALAAFIAVTIAPPPVFMIAMALLSVIGIFELFKTAGALKFTPLFITAAAGALIFCLYRFIPYEHTLKIYLMLFAVVTVFTVLFKHEEFKASDGAAAAALTLLICVSFGASSHLRDMENGGYFVWLPFVAAWSTDTLAYFSGMLFGKHKLCEKLSPKKTVEGALGGIVGAIAGTLIYTAFIPSDSNVFLAIAYGAVASALSQAGDIFASCIKREHGIKDFGNLMPGHGGVLDRFDSLLLTAPFTYVFITVTHLI